MTKILPFRDEVKTSVSNEIHFRGAAVCVLTWLGKKKRTNRDISVGNLGQQRVCNFSGENQAFSSFPSLPAAPSPAPGRENIAVPPALRVGGEPLSARLAFLGGFFTSKKLYEHYLINPDT